MGIIKAIALLVIALLAQWPVEASANANEFCPDRFDEPIGALLTHIFTDDAFAEKYSAYIYPGPAYLFEAVGAPACTLGPASPVASSDFVVTLADNDDLDRIAAPLGYVLILVISQVTFEDENRVIINLASGNLRDGIFYGCGGPAVLYRSKRVWRFESWKPTRCS